MAKLFLAFILLLATCQSISGATTPPAAPPNSTAEYLDAHNTARSSVGVPPLKWSLYLSTLASRYVRYQRDKASCDFANLTTSKYGGNQLMARGPVALTPRMVVEAWVAEKDYYDHVNNTCAGDHQCGVYTQVVWRKSEELGCAQSMCFKEQTSLAICLYNPPGNVIGERPY